MICWPMFRYVYNFYWRIFTYLLYYISACWIAITSYYSSGYRGAILAALVPGINIIRMILLGLGIMKDEAIVKSMSRNGDYRLQYRRIIGSEWFSEKWLWYFCFTSLLLSPPSEPSLALKLLIWLTHMGNHCNLSDLLVIYPRAIQNMEQFKDLTSGLPYK